MTKENENSRFSCPCVSLLGLVASFIKLLAARVLRFAKALAGRLRLEWAAARVKRQNPTPQGVASGIRPDFPPIWYLDWPDVTKDNPDPARFRVKGWIASVKPVSNLAFDNPAIAQALRFEIKPGADVEKVFGMPAMRFEGDCAFDLVKDMRAVSLFFETDGERHEIVVPVHSGHVDVAAQKARKLARLVPLMVCPSCRSGPDAHANEFVCRACGAHFTRGDQCFNFLPESLAREAGIQPTENVSANQYNGLSLNYIHSYDQGLILDCGAGFRNKYYENVVNLEIVAYDSTDVLAVSEHLPFRDSVFDVVFSFAVIEHVKDPFAAARELVRVLKPGGILFCQAPLLSPLHAYPHHYFNMTMAGLSSLFDGIVDVERLEPLMFGQPVHCLSWFLNSYIRGLPPEIAKDFKNKKISDLIEPADRYLGAPFVTCLRKETREELACCNYILARKRAPRPE